MRGHEVNPHENLKQEDMDWLESKARAQQPDYYEQQMKQIVLTVLQGPDADDVAGKIAAALRSNGYVQWTGIGGAMEKQQAAQ